MWRTSSWTCRAAFLAVLCGGAASARAGIIVFQPIEAPKFTDLVMKPLSVDATQTILLAVPADLRGGHDLLPDFDADFRLGAALGRGDAFARAANPAEYLQMGFSSESSFDGLLPALHTGRGDPVADVPIVSGGVHGRPLVGAAGGQTSDEFVRRAPVPGALLLAVFGLGVAHLGWRRFV